MKDNYDVYFPGSTCIIKLEKYIGSVRFRFGFSAFFSVRFAAEEKKIGSVRFGFRDEKKFGSVRFGFR